MIEKQYGKTLIELMVSMMLGLGLVAGMGQLFVQSQKSFALQRNISDMTDDGAFVLEALAKGLLLAGYSESGDVSSLPAGNVFGVSGISDIAFATGEFIHGKDGTKDSQLVFRYKVSSKVELNNFICTNGEDYVTADKNKVITIRIYKDNDTDGIPVFYCKMKKENESAKNAQPLISQIQKLTFRYGIHNKTNDTFHYAKAAEITNWTEVFAVKVHVVMRSADKNLTRNRTGWKIEDVQEYPTTDEKRLYKVFSKTIFLRAVDD